MGPPPEPWARVEAVDLDHTLRTNPTRLTETVHDLTCRYVNRIPTVFVLDVDPEELNAPETTDAPPHELGTDFTFLQERLTELISHNSYDARSEKLIWWWAHKAAARLDVIPPEPFSSAAWHEPSNSGGFSRRVD